MDGGGGGYRGVGGVPCTHTHAYARTHACTCMLNMLNESNLTMFTSYEYEEEYGLFLYNAT